MREKHPQVRISDGDGTIMRDLDMLGVLLAKSKAELLRDAVEAHYKDELAHVRQQSDSFFALSGTDVNQNGS